MKKALLFLTLFLWCASAHAAVMYAKAAGGLWSAAGTWSATGSGGADSVGPPLASTDVIFETGSGNVTIDTTAVCRSLDTTSGTGAYAGTITHTTGVGLSIGDGTAGAGNVALKLRAGMTYAPTADSCLITFVSTSVTQQTIDCGGKSMGNLTFNGAGGKWAMTTGVTARASSTLFTLSAGTLETDGTADIATLSHTWGRFADGVSTRAINLGNSLITLTGTASTVWNGGSVASGLTVTPGNSQLTLSGATATFGGGSNQSYYDIVMTGSGVATCGLSAGGSCHNFTRTGTAIKTDTLVFTNGTTVTGTLTLTGNSSTNRLLVQATTVGTQLTITNTGATMTWSNVDFQDIKLSTAFDASAITGLSGNCGGNSGITFTTGVPQFWKTTTSGIKTWSTAGNWFLATNGVGAGRVPLPQDDATFDSSSIGAINTTIQTDMPRSGQSILFTGVTNTPTLSATAANTIYGSLTLQGTSSMTLNGSAILTLGGRGSYTITTAGQTIRGCTLAAPTGTYSLMDALTSTGNWTITAGTFDAQNTNVNAAVSMNTLNATGTNTRTITFGTGIWSLTGNNTTVLNIDTMTNLTVNRGNPIQLTYSGAIGTRTISYGLTGGLETNAIDLSVTAGTDTLAINDTRIVRNLDFTGFTGIYSIGTNRLTIYGNLTLGTGMTVTGGTGVTTFSGTSGPYTLTQNSVAFDAPITFNGVGGTWQLGDNFTIGSTRTITLTNGTLNGNGHNFSMGFFSSTNSNNRTITFGAGTWSITGSGATVWSVGTATNLVVNRGNPVQFSYSGAIGTRTFSEGPTGATEANSVDFSITAGSDIVNFTGSSTVHTLDFTGFTGTWSNNNFVTYGNLTVPLGMTITAGTAAITFSATSGTQTITTNAQALDFPIIFNGVGGTFQLADNFTGGTTRTITLTNGTFNTNNKTMSIGAFSTSNANTRVLTIGTGAMTLTGTGTVFSCTNGTGLTVNQTGAIIVNDTSATAKTWSGGNPVTWGPVTFSGDNIQVNGSNIFSTLNLNNAGLVNGTLFQAGFTQQIGAMTSNGSAGSLCIINSTTTATHTLSYTGVGVVSLDYLNIQHSVATPANTWYAGADSMNNQATVTAGSGWIFTVPPAGNTGAFFQFMS